MNGESTGEVDVVWVGVIDDLEVVGSKVDV